MYSPPITHSHLPAVLYWITAIIFAGSIYMSLHGNLTGQFYEHWLSIPTSLALLFAHAKRNLLVIPIYGFYVYVTFERMMILVYGSQSSIFLLPVPIILGLVLLLWALGQYIPLRRRTSTEPPPE